MGKKTSIGIPKSISLDQKHILFSKQTIGVQGKWKLKSQGKILPPSLLRMPLALLTIKILINKIINKKIMGWNFEPKILLQGINEPQAMPYIEAMQCYDMAQLVGVSSEYIGDSYHNIQVFDLVTEAYDQLNGITTTIIFNQPNQVLDSALEAINAGIKQIIINTNDIPPLDLFKLTTQADREGVKILGTNKAGILIPEKLNYGVLHPHRYQPGSVGMINYGHSNLSPELALLLQDDNQGVSMVVNLGDATFKKVDWEMLFVTFNQHKETKTIWLSLNKLLHLDYEKLAKIILEFAKKPVLIRLLDPDNLNEVISFPQPRIITDQIPVHLNQVKSPQMIVEYWQDQGLDVVQ